MTVQRLTDSAYLQLVGDAQVLKLRRGKPAILLTSDQRIIKHIYRRSWFSSSRIWPYAQRFINNATLLHQRGIKVPTIHGRYYYPTFGCDILVYDYLDGKSLFTYAQENNFSYLEKTPAFLSRLHELGIYFRDFHLDNVIIHNNEFALIDIASVKCRRQTRGLNFKYRAKNIAHLFSKNEDQEIYRIFGKNNFLRRYVKSANLSRRKTALLYYLVSRYRLKKPPFLPAKTNDLEINDVASQVVSS